MKKILVFTTYDNFYLKKLIINLSKNKKFKFYYFIISDYKSINNIFVKLATFGLIKSFNFLIRSIIIDIKGENLVSKLNKKNIILGEKSEDYLKNFIKLKKIDLILSVNYPKKISQNIFNAPKFGAINNHLGNLPKYRGRYPVINAIMNGDKKIYSTIHKINEKIDDGAVILKGGISNKLNDNIEAKYEKLFSITEKLITKSLFKIFNRNKIKSKKSVKSIYNKKPNIFKIIKIYIFFNFIRF